MADKNNPGQFGNRPDTEAMASEGGKKSSGNFKNNPDKASKVGKIGGQHSHRS